MTQGPPRSAVVQPPGHRRSLCLAAVLLPHPLPHRLQDLAVDDGDRDAALYAASSVSTDGLAGLWAQFSELSFDNYLWLTEDALYFNAYLSSLVIAGVSTFLTLLVGYPIAYGMARAPATLRPTLLMLVILPFWTSLPDPRLCLDRHPQAGGAAQPVPAGDRRHRRAADHPQHAYGGLYRHRLFLPALHGAAALFGAREDGRLADRGRPGSRLPADHAPSGRSPSRCRCRASSPAASWSSSRPSASSSFPTCSAARRR